MPMPPTSTPTSPPPTSPPAEAPPVGRSWVLVTAPAHVDLSEVRAAWSPRCEVFVCSGPEHGHTCPLVDEGCCPIVDRADVILNGLDPTRTEVAALFDVVAARYPDIPVIDLDALTPR